MPNRTLHRCIPSASIQEESQPLSFGDYDDGLVPVDVDQQPHGSGALRFGKSFYVLLSSALYL